ncbi:MAG TPA: J domain-containing protein, partial [Coleofasciculaceae cyanobacterium]
MSDLERHYRVLGLEPGASLEEVNQAYRDLAFIWHPDRLPKDNPRLQEKAQEKLKELNQAREHLRAQRPGESSKTDKSRTARTPEPPAPARPPYSPPPPKPPTYSSPPPKPESHTAPPRYHY